MGSKDIYAPYGGFHGHGGTPIAGWFLLGKMPSFEVDDSEENPHGDVFPPKISTVLHLCIDANNPPRILTSYLTRVTNPFQRLHQGT